ncbi:MAG: cell division protein SepF [Candidatus Aenigmarchaeota archaeon]|nr:cell division protein SepF [Candidatus Aenigmarchaeota archaeon]
MFGKSNQPEDYAELDENFFKEHTSYNVVVDTLRSFDEIEKVQNALRDGKVVFLRIKEMRDADINELKRSVDRLKKTCSAMSGDIAGVDEDVLIITPNYAKVFRG